jgi:hypothetical protein
MRWIFVIVLPFCWIFANVSGAVVIERVVAIVNGDIILESEFMEAKRLVSQHGVPDDYAVLDRLISRLLILQEALRSRPGMNSYLKGTAEEDELINDYIKKRVVSLIHVPFREVEEYYNQHREEYGGRDVYSVWTDIEEILRKKKTPSAVAEHVRKLREKAYIRVQVDAARYK